MTRPLTALSGQTRPVEAVAPPKEFDGSIPEDYDRHLGPLLFDFSGRDMARRVERGVEGRPAPRVLEVACGTGISTEHLWRQLPSGAELVATVQEECFWHLQAPIVRVAGWETPYPHAFEWDYFPGQDRILDGIRKIMETV